jgi:hypothetical protein
MGDQAAGPPKEAKGGNLPQGIVEGHGRRLLKIGAAHNEHSRRDILDGLWCPRGRYGESFTQRPGMQRDDEEGCWIWSEQLTLNRLEIRMSQPEFQMGKQRGTYCELSFPARLSSLQDLIARSEHLSHYIFNRLAVAANDSNLPFLLFVGWIWGRLCFNDKNASQAKREQRIKTGDETLSDCAQQF